MKVIASGSASFYIDRKFKDSLAGRKFLFEVRTLNFNEFLVILVIWAAVVGIIYLNVDLLVSVISVCAGYYLSKWIVLRKESQNAVSK